MSRLVWRRALPVLVFAVSMTASALALILTAPDPARAPSAPLQVAVAPPAAGR